MSGHGKSYAIDGLVLRESAYGENDSVFSLLTAEKGRITVLAKGARSLKSHVRGGIQPYTYGNYEIAAKGGPGWVRNLSVTDAFLGLRTELLPLSLAAYLSDVAYELSGEGVPAPELLRLMLNTFYLIANRIDPNDEEELLRVKAAFELRVMTISGYEPDLSVERSEDNGDCYLDVMNGSLLSGEALRKRGEQAERAYDPSDLGSATILLPVLPPTLDAMRYIVSAPPKRVYAFMLPDRESARNLARVTESYLEHHLERTFESLRFFRTLVSKP